MLASGNMLELLSEGEALASPADKNDDHNLSDVLDFCSNKSPNNNFLRYPDGQEEPFSFSNWGELN